jgi:hypothetical protein
LAVVALVLFCFASGAMAYENANGLGYFALQIPNPASMSVDGMGGDWAWFDPDLIVGPDQMANTLGAGEIPTKDDIDIAIHAGWTPEPDNRLYLFVRVIDDTMNVDETNMDNGWKDDNLELILDPDHSGDWSEGTSSSLRTGHQQWTFSISTPTGYPQIAWLRFNQPPEMQWGIEQGLVEAAVDVKPDAAVGKTIYGDAPVTVGYEVRMAAFDPYAQEGLDASVRHVFAANQTIGMSVIVDEADSEGRTHQIATHINEAGAHSSDFTSEFTMLGIGDYATAVQASSWGAVKSLLR